MHTIYAGAKPIKRLGDRQFHMLDFLLRYPGYHSIATDATSQRVLRSLVNRRVISVNEYDQAKFDQTHNK